MPTANTHSFEIAGLQPLTLLDFPGRVAAVVFSQGCQLRCSYCHNPQLLPCGQAPHAHSMLSRLQPHTVAQLLPWLAQRQKVLTGVVFSGGEATLQAGLPNVLRAVKALGLATKLDTNGLCPEVLTALLAQNLLDYVALDVKAPPKKYATVVGLPAEAWVGLAAKVAASLAVLKASGIAFECRTTVASPLLNDEDVVAIGHWVAGVPRWVLQAFQPVNSPLALAEAATLLPPAQGQLAQLRVEMAPLVGECLVR